jgi:ABC-type nickel/cobalt efflux system permease component RcnA
MTGFLPILTFGFLLGIKHAFEPDHVVAVTTLLAKNQSFYRAASIGALWGIGHTTTLFVIGMAVLIFRISIPEAIAARLEGAVGIMLILLGFRSLFWKEHPVHEHEHSHDGAVHTHAHIDHSHRHQHKLIFTIGAVHGLTGSGALMILVLSLIQNTVQGLVYILLFGIGSIAGMAVMSVLFGIPFAKSMEKFNRAEIIIRRITGIISLLFGLSIIIALTKTTLT